MDSTSQPSTSGARSALYKAICGVASPLLAMALCGSVVSAQEFADQISLDQHCREIQLSQSLDSFSWPVFIDNGQTMLGIDGAARQIVKVSLDIERDDASEKMGLDQSAVSRKARAGVEAVPFVEGSPFVAFAQSGDQIVQAYGDGAGLKVGWFDQELKLQSVSSFGEDGLKNLLPSKRSENERRLLAPYRWIVADGHLVGYGAVSTHTSDQDFELGFFDQPLPESDSEEILPARLFHSFANPSFYLIGNPYFVSRGSEIYFLEMGAYPSLYRFDSGLGLPSEKISGLPGENTRLSDPEAHMVGRDGRDVLMERLDQFEGPWGLYEQDGEVHVLNRALGDDGVVEWHLHRLAIEDNLVDSKKSSHVKLPTNASQVVLVPGLQKEQWLILEQASDRTGKRELSKMLSCRISGSSGGA